MKLARTRLRQARVGMCVLAVSVAASGTGGAAEYQERPGPSGFVAPGGRASGQGTKGSPWSMARANSSAKPGDTLVLLGGSYATPIQPARSGAEGRPIVYRAAAKATPLFTGRGTAIQVTDRSWITVDGITARDIGRFVIAERSHHLTITRCRFTTARDWESTRLRTMGDFLTFTHNVVKDGSDSVMLEGGSHHLIERNTFHKAGHVCLVLQGVQRTVVRHNTFENPVQKCFEVFSYRDRRGIGKRRSVHNLIEHNVFGPSSSSGIQYAGSRSILRRNVFRRCRVGMSFSNYVSKKDFPEAWHNFGNRFYNNVLVDNRTAVLLVTDMRTKGRDKGMKFGDNIMMNNIMFRNRADRGDKCRPTVQIAFDWDSRPADAGVFYNLLGEGPGAEAFYWCDAKYNRPRLPESMPIRKWQEHYPAHAHHNLVADPKFVDGDFRLRPGSPCIDAGGALTRTRTAGRGRRIEVLDAAFFCDGLKRVDPDLVRVGAERVKVVEVDYERSRLRVHRDIAWKAGAPVNLDFHGSAPDIGAIEFKKD